MSLYVDANYTVDDADYFIDNPGGLYVACEYWLTNPAFYAEGDELCPIIVTDPVIEGVYIGRKRKRRIDSPLPLVPAFPNDDDEVLVKVLSLFMKGPNVH